MPDNSGSIDLSTLGKDEQEAVKRLAEERGGPVEDDEPTSEAREVLTAFLVLVPVNGSPEVMAFEDSGLSLITPPTHDLIFGAASTIVKDSQVAETAHASGLATVQAMMAQTRAMAEEAQNQGIRSKLGL